MNVVSEIILYNFPLVEFLTICDQNTSKLKRKTWFSWMSVYVTKGSVKKTGKLSL